MQKSSATQNNRLKLFSYNSLLQKSRKQSGFSLISVLTGIVISISFLIMVQQFTHTSAKAQQFNNAQASLSEEGRYIISDLRRIIGAAGLDITTAIHQDAANANLAVSDGLAIFSTTSDTSDEIVIGSLRKGGCTGQIGSLATTNIQFVQLRLDGTKLQCREGTSTTTLGGNYETLSNSVHGLRVLYGLDMDGDGYPNAYKDDQNVTNNDVRRIRAIRVALLLGSGHNQIAPSDAFNNRTYELLGSSVTTNSDTKREILRVYETTIYLRNLSNTVVRFN